MLNYAVCKNWQFEDQRHAYSTRDTMLYALGIGMGVPATDPAQLRFVYEQDLQVVPTMVSILAMPAGWVRHPSTGVDYVKLVHGEQDVRILGPLAPKATVRADIAVESVTDKGPGKGAVMVVRRQLFDAAGGAALAEVRQTSFMRADGGFSAESGISDPPAPALPAVPERPADHQVELTSLEQAALIYRLCGDYNPLHADPEVAAKAGFKRPILHGLCTYGMAGHAALRVLCDYDASRLRRVATRFSSPVYPGETVRFEFWRGASAGLWHLRARVDARDVTVLNNGVVEVA